MEGRETQLALPISLVPQLAPVALPDGTPIEAMSREISPDGYATEAELYFGSDGRGGDERWRVSFHKVGREIGPTTITFRSHEDERAFWFLCAIVQHWIRRLYWTVAFLSFCRLAGWAIEPQAGPLDGFRPVSDGADGDPLAEGVHNFYERTKSHVAR